MAEMNAGLIEESFVPTRRSTVASEELDEEIVLYDESTGKLHLLSTTAGVVWNAFDGTRTVGLLITLLSELYDTEKGVVAAEVLELTRRMGQQGLLEGVVAEEDLPGVPPTRHPVGRSPAAWEGR